MRLFPSANANPSDFDKMIAMAEHAKLAQFHANAAAEILASLKGTSAVLPKPAKPATLADAVLSRNGADHTPAKAKFLPTMKRNCDLAYQIFLEAKKPLHKEELLKRMIATGKTQLTKASSLAYYIRLDDRFEKAGHGLWYLTKESALL